MARKKLIEIQPLLCPDGDPYASVDMVKKTVELKTDDKVIFRQENVEYPAKWSETAAYILASKFFRGHLGTPERETSIRQVLNRIVDTISRFGKSAGYFDAQNERRFNAELKKILLSQMAAFNSPVFFNVGAVDNPQGSACFILRVEDDLDSIAKLQVKEISIFSQGSGSGCNLSYLRGAGEPLSKGGWASGPLSFMRAYTAWAGTIRSGGILRRAAKLVRLDDNHPDVFNGREDGSDFISFKSAEEKKARALWSSGYTPDEAYATVSGQSANLSVGISNAFMEAVREDKEWNLLSVVSGKLVRSFKAVEMLRSIARNIRECGDPGVQFTDNINEWWTCPKLDKIRSSNPCIVGSTRVYIKEGKKTVLKQVCQIKEKTAEILSYDFERRRPVFAKATFLGKTRQNAKVVRLKTAAGEIRLTPDHEVMTSRGWIKAADVRKGDKVYRVKATGKILGSV